MRMRNDSVECFFKFSDSADAARMKARLLAMRVADKVTVRPLKNKEEWKEKIGGNYPIDYCFAEWLWQRTQTALAETKKHIKMDERYTKHKAMAFTSPETWLKSILNTVAHNTYKKVSVRFSVPLDMLPPCGLPELMLKRARLEFGQFKKRPLNGWIIGYSLNAAEDKVDIAFLSSEAMKNAKWYDENGLTDQTVLNEAENPDKIIMEA
jgi:hypothetical protein